MKLPPYGKFPEIISGKVILRQVLPSDMKDLLEITFYNGRPAVTLEDALEIQDRINLDYQNSSSIHWGIVDKATNNIVGTLGYYRGFANGIGELGCVLKPDFRGKGFMTTAIKLASEFGLNVIGLTKIIAITNKQNDKAIKLLERLDFFKTADLDDDKIEFNLNKSNPLLTIPAIYLVHDSNT